MQKPITEWNTAKKIWQYSTDDHLFALWAPFLEIWPTAATMRNGRVFEQQTPERPITVSESSLLRSPTASQGEGGALGEEEARKRGNTVGIRDQAMDIARANGAKVSRQDQNLIPTPTTRDYKDGTEPHERDGITQKELDAGNPKHRLETVTNWGKFEPAIRRWEIVLGRPAPSPTKPDGKDGAHRLSSAFTEWMMGLPEGWITDCGLSRNDELKACGNGVVPQQAELALRILLEDLPLISRGGGQVNLPTPTVSDTFTDKLASSQQKEGSMHSVTLPQAVRMIGETNATN